jgi:hypothetical protein
MKVKVAFTREKEPDFVSKSIMWVMKTDYSHVFFIHEGNIYHSIGLGVCKQDLESYLEDHIIVKEFEVELACSKEVFEAFVAGEDGKDYSQSQYIGFIFPMFQSFFDNNNEKRICSEFVAVVLQKYGDVVLSKDADFTSPKDVYDILDKGGK